MDNVRVNYEMVKSVMERAQWYYACAKAMRTGVREIGFVENISDEENLNEEEEQYREYYKRYQARIAGYPDLDVFWSV